MTMSSELKTATANFVTASHRLPTLFDLGDEEYRLLALLEEVSDHDDEIELQDQLALIDQLLVDKLSGYVSIIRTLEAMMEARKIEADRLSARAKTAQRHADWLRNRLLVHMQTTGRDRVETARFTLAIRTNPPSVVVVDAAVVPREFERTKITVDVDKRAILEHIKTSGEIPPGIDIQRAQRLEIR